MCVVVYGCTDGNGAMMREDVMVVYQYLHLIHRVVLAHFCAPSMI